MSDSVKHNLGLAGILAKTFITSPLSSLSLFAMLGMGIIGLMLTPRQEDPQISVPMVDIFVQSPGVSATQLAALATEPLELMMNEIEGVKHVYSVTNRGSAVVTVQFKVGLELVPSLVKIYNKLESNKGRIPPGVSEPLIRAKGIDDVSIVNLTLWSKEVDDSVLRNLANDVVHELETIPNTGQSLVVGGRSTQIKIEVTPEKLSGFGITLDQIAETVKSANTLQAAGQSESGDNNFTVYSGNFLYSASDVANLVISVNREGNPVYIRDIAKVYMGPSEAKNLVEFYTGKAYVGNKNADGFPAVTVAIAKQKGSNAVPVANDILAKIEALKGDLIPSNIHVDVTRNYGHTAKSKVDELLFKLVIATGAVTILIFFALGLRPAIVVTVVIPIVILMTVFYALLIDYSINRVSLFALIFSIGILVDDAIVVVENIYRRWIESDSLDIDTAIDATREVGNPTIIATLTVVAALLPMGFVRELMGPYMAPIPVLGSAAMLISLFAAFAFTPWLTYKFRPSKMALKQMERAEHKTITRTNKIYGGMIRPLIEYKLLGWLTLFGIIGIFFISISLFYTQSVITKMLPFDNKSEFEVVIDMPTSTALPVTANVTRQVAEVIKKIPEMTTFQTYVGTAQPFNFNGLVRHYYLRNQSDGADIAVQLSEKGDRDRSSHEIALELRENLRAIAKANNAKITVAESPPGPPVLQSMVGEVYGNDDEDRRAVARQLTNLFHKSTILEDVDNLMIDPHEVIHFKINTEKAARAGVSIADINRNLSMAMGSVKVVDVKVGRSKEPTFVMLEVPLSIRTNVNSLVELPIPTKDRTGIVALGNLGLFVKHQAENIVYHKDLRPVEYVVADAVNHLPAPLYAINEIHSLMEQTDFRSPVTGKKVETYWFGAPDSFYDTVINWDGEWRVTFVTFRDMGMAFGIAIILIYILVVGQFRNFKIPLVVISPIPLTMIGIVLGHWTLGAEFTATSMIGFIALAGIIVRNSILLVDFAQIELRSGKSLVDAVVNSGVVRMRPIIITAFALVGGSSVILTDPIFQGMAVSLLFGVVISTLLTLIVVPLGCISLGDALYPDDMPNLPKDPTPPTPPKPVPTVKVSTEKPIKSDTDTQIPVPKATFETTDITETEKLAQTEAIKTPPEIITQVLPEPKTQVDNKPKVEEPDIRITEDSKDLVDPEIAKNIDKEDDKNSAQKPRRRSIRLKQDLE